MDLKNDHAPAKKQSHELADIFERLQREFFSPGFLKTGLEGDFLPKIELEETESQYHVSAELPGMDQKDINITLRDNNLIIEGEKKSETKNEGKGFFNSEFSYGNFFRSIALEREVDPQKVEATYVNGVLKVKLDKLNKSHSKATRIEIQ